MSLSVQESLRRLPSVNALMRDAALSPLVAQQSHAMLVRACRAVLDEARTSIQAGQPPPERWAEAVAARVAAWTTPSLSPVINATGVVIHTNLGRAPLSEAALAAMHAVGAGYSNLEYDLAAGERGSRYDHVGPLLAELSGAEAGLVVNNNAAALVLVLATLASGREVALSRAHLVEIGGGFRIPEILRQSGARLLEVGTTNRTYVDDFSAASTAETALWLRVHPSNFQIVGFTHQPTLAALVAAAQAQGRLVVDDVGSGALLDTRPFGLAQEPLVQESVAAGADVVLFSGDKLLGGPQAGCIVGRGPLIAQLRRHPLARALRVDKGTLAALDATLRAYQRGRALEELPLWQQIARSEAALRATAERWQAHLEALGIAATLRAGQSTIGGGSLPGETLPTWLLALARPHPDADAARLRARRPAIVPRIERDLLLFDPRTVLPAQEEVLLSGIATALSAP